MNQPPKDWPRISSAVFYEDAGKAIDWLCSAFGFEMRLRIDGEGGRIEHSELEFGGGSSWSPAWTSRAKDRSFAASPRTIGGKNTQTMCVFVDDVDAHCAHAREHGARIDREPKTDDYGEDYGAHRTYGAIDPEGHHWWFMQGIRDANPRGK